MSEPRQIPIAQRQANFAAMTRQHMHMLPKQIATSENSTLQFIYPKTRLLAQTYLLVDVEVDGGSDKTNPSDFDKYKIIRKITMDLNNGFSPVVVSGEELALYNCISTHPTKILNKTNGLLFGDATNYTFALEIKNTLNDSMLQGLILLQNNSTMVTLNVDIGQVTDALQSGTLKKVTVQPMIVTYSVPSVEAGFPDISLLKLIQAKTHVFQSAGTHTINLDTGTIYRKLAFYITDSNNKPLHFDKLPAEFQLAFNTADIPYSISPKMLRYLNADKLGVKMPQGYYIFDFSSQSPLIGYGGSRDYIDTEKLTQFTLQFTSSEACKVTVIAEQLTRLM